MRKGYVATRAGIARLTVSFACMRLKIMQANSWLQMSFYIATCNSSLTEASAFNAAYVKKSAILCDPLLSDALTPRDHCVNITVENE